jgi:hypothetical protein
MSNNNLEKKSTDTPTKEEIKEVIDQEIKETSQDASSKAIVTEMKDFLKENLNKILKEVRTGMESSRLRDIDEKCGNCGLVHSDSDDDSDSSTSNISRHTDDISWESLNKLLDSHYNVTKIFLKLLDNTDYDSDTESQYSVRS